MVTRSPGAHRSRSYQTFDRTPETHPICGQIGYRFATLATILIFSLLGCSNESKTPKQTSIPQHSSPVTTELLMEEPTREKPVVWLATLTPASAKPGEKVILTIHGKIMPGWHIYAAERASGPSIPTRHDLLLPTGITTVSEWKHPQPKIGVSSFGPVSKYTDKFESTIDLLLADSLTPGTLELECTVVFQACNFELCLPPQTIQQKLSLNITTEYER
jgi:DsbC/DsbD-like thiol-disulfide interchange protein